MAKPTAYTAEHQGFTFTRKSHRTYTHAVVVVPSDGKPGVWSWVGRPDLVPAQVSQAQKRFAGRGQVVAVPVTSA